MGGFAGIGGSSATTDRNRQLSSTGNLNSIFNWSLPTGQSQEAAGSSTLSGALGTLQPAQQYFQGLLQPGRTQAGLNAAPAVNATLDSADATRKQSGNFGTSRSGGTAAANRESGTQTQSTIDNLINSNITGGQAAGAAGLQGISGAQAGIAGQQLGNAQNLLGLGATAETNIMNSSITSRVNSQNINQETKSEWESAIGALLGVIP